MKKSKIIAVVLALSVMLTTILSIGLCVNAETANVTLSADPYELLPADVLNAGQPTRDSSKFNADGHDTVGSDGHTFAHAGAGDKFTLNVDFGSYGIDKFTYTVPVLRGTTFSLSICVDGNAIGETTAVTTNGGTGYIEFATPLNGIHEFSMEVVSDKTAWPGDDWGYLTFSSSSVKMTSSTLEIPASTILSLGTVTRDATKFDNGGNVNVLPSTDGLYFWHSGNGDKFTFDVDFGSYEVNKFKFNCAVRGPMSVKVYDGADLIGEATCTEFVGDGICTLSKTLTGTKTITLELVTEATAWPGPDWGAIEFSYENTQPINPNPSTADNSVILPIIVTMVIAAGLIMLKKKEF